ncbi:LysR substrate-binding domain-containing protein [Fundicoccus culcitae]|uniref:LysR substrate-binding domain-containing protein n=1 Tax=Fundicoccus culcitae TaxID=2969821 RepID=A0ABY5P4H1_9LACT|nr:LysR substrate-binding domain-containing protein [Fundicoccus culcitae]UUX33632.1 LysR substrate-binding domain-containing protein [Fundicoccus culcitae]
MIEQGAFELKNQLLLGQIDFGILLAPNGLNASIFNEMHLHHDQLMAYVHKDHPLAQKETLVWRDFQHQKIIMFDETFMIHHLLNSKFSAYNCYPTQVVHSSSWDFFIEAVKTNNFITILPRPVSDFIGGNTILELPIEDTIDWDVVLTYPKKNHYSVLETYLINSLKDYFTAGLDITPIDKYLVTV